MEVGSRHSAGRSDQADNLSAGYSVPRRHEWLAEVEIRGDQPAAVIDVDDVAGEKEVVHQRDDAAIGSAHGLANGSAEINTKVAAGHLSVEQTSRSKFTRDCRSPRAKKRCGPHQRRVVRALPDFAGACVFAADPRCGDGIKGAREAAVHSERLRYRRWKLGQNQPRPYRFDFPGRATDFSDCQQTASRGDRNGTDRVPRSRR